MTRKPPFGNLPPVALPPRGWRRRLSALAVAVLATGPALAQDDAGLQLDIDLSTSLRYNDNLDLRISPPGGSFLWDNRLGFSLSSGTRTSTLTLGGSGVLRLADLPAGGSDRGFEDPRLSLGYTRTVAASRLSLGADWRRADLRYLDPLTEPVPVEDLTTGELLLEPETGSRETLGFRGNYETGIGGPLGLTLAMSRREVGYHDTVSPDYYDSSRDRLSLGLRLELGPVLRASVTASGDRYGADNPRDTDRDTRRLDFRLAYAPDKATQLAFGLGRTEIEEKETIAGLRQTSESAGTTAILVLTRALGNGEIGLAYTRDFGSTGRRESLGFSRSLDLRDGSFAGMLGIGRNDDGNTVAVADIGWKQALQRGNWSVTLSRGITTDDEDEDVVVTRLNAGYDHRINPGNVLDLELGLSETRTMGEEDATRRIRLSAGWRHDLTQDVDLSMGYEHTWLDDEGAADARRSNVVYLRLGTQFSFRP